MSEFKYVGSELDLFAAVESYQNNLIRIKTAGITSNRDGIGAKITLKLANKTNLLGFVKSGSSYCSQSELPLTFGLGKADKVSSIEVVWPSGRVDVASEVTANQFITIQEGVGIVSTQPIVFVRP